MAYQDYFTQSANTLNQAASNALPSIQSRDTAAARVRARLAANSRAIQSGLQDTLGGRNTGRLISGLNRNYADTQNALASGLADVENNYQTQRQQGAQVLSGIGQNQASLGTGLATALDQEAQTGLAGQKISNEFNLGTEANRLRGLEIDTTRDIEEQRGLVDFLQAFGTFGNARGGTDAAGQQFDTRLNELINQLLGR